ncbi:histidine phosphatase family protein [Uruburuella testudinis]|uniref:Histidine phosphatase family protein n=1 Tax=Uruburuella testudinis TaxID=1282863 RepID=A0ABY4DQR0_9NEIS|nr:histidine phosphatase family protein [Uruburuella testudinis]UOO81392.1 histidine phosphatase family protein [Uruburuella testudinis]
MNLILWRHAEAEYGPPDLARQLTEKGRRQASTAAAWLRNRLPQDTQVWVSQAARSRQTADYLVQDYTILATLNPDIYARTLPRLLETAPRNGTLVIVGHQPWLGQLSAFLLNGDWGGDAYWSYKKGGFWWFQLKQDHNGFHAKLKAVLTPEMLA